MVEIYRTHEIARRRKGSPERSRDLRDSSQTDKEYEPDLYELMCVVLELYEARADKRVWEQLLEPLRALVPCEYVRIYVQAGLAETSPDHAGKPLGPFKAESLALAQHVVPVQQWSPYRIEGAAALEKKVFRLPCFHAQAQQWEQYEEAKYMNGKLRCCVCVPLFDSEGQVLAVAKLYNRLSLLQSATQHGPPIRSRRSDKHYRAVTVPKLEFSDQDTTVLSAFSAIFACILPQPYLGMDVPLVKRPSVMLTMSEEDCIADVTWQLDGDVGGHLAHEISYGTAGPDDEVTSWTPHAVGLLPTPENRSFRHRVPHLAWDETYVFCVRVRTAHGWSRWSEPSRGLSTYLAPPLPRGDTAALRLSTVAGGVVRLTWPPFETGAKELAVVEYLITVT